MNSHYCISYSKIIPSFFNLKKAPPLISVFSPQGRRGKLPSGAQNRYTLRLAGIKGLRYGCAGWDRLAKGGNRLCWSYYGLLEWNYVILIFSIRHQGRGVWSRHGLSDALWYSCCHLYHLWLWREQDVAEWRDWYRSA